MPPAPSGEIAAWFFDTTLLRDLSPVLVRLQPSLHAALGSGRFSPRKLDAPLVWPLEAPMLEASVHALFREVRVETELPTSSDVRQSAG